MNCAILEFVISRQREPRYKFRIRSMDSKEFETLTVKMIYTSSFNFHNSSCRYSEHALIEQIVGEEEYSSLLIRFNELLKSVGRKFLHDECGRQKER